MTDSSYSDLARKIRQGIGENFSDEPQIRLRVEDDALSLTGNEAGLAIFVATVLSQMPTDAAFSGDVKKINYQIAPSQPSRRYVLHKRLYKHFNTAMGILVIIAGIAVLAGIFITILNYF